jgi:hypothetical protein
MAVIIIGATQEWRMRVLVADAKCGHERSGPNTCEAAVRVTGSV